MRFKLSYDGELGEDYADISEFLHWLADQRFDMPDDVLVYIDIK